MSLQKGDHVITNKCNHGRILSITNNIANVKIGNIAYNIELQNLTNINHGKLFKVEYIENNCTNKTLVFLKHATVIFDLSSPNLLYNTIHKLLQQKLNISENISIIKITIP